MIPYSFRGGKEYDLEHDGQSLIDETNLSLFRIEMAKRNPYEQEQYLQEMMT